MIAPPPRDSAGSGVVASAPTAPTEPTGPISTTEAVHSGIDMYAGHRGRRGFLYRINPLAKFLAPLPAIVLLAFVRDLDTPLALLTLSYAVVLLGVSISPRLLLVLLSVPVAGALVGVGFAVWTDSSGVDHSQIAWQLGGWTMYTEALLVGLATGARIAAIVALALIVGLSTTGADLVRAGIQQLRIPYRIGYTALAAFRFVPRFGHELDVIRQAHRVRGAYGMRGPFGALARWFGYLVPLLAGAIRHAESVALAMEARAFGAYPTRTERHRVPWRTRDTVFALATLAVSAMVFCLTFPWTLS